MALLAFLLANWRVVIPGLLVLGLGVDDGWHRVALANLRASQAQEIAAAEAAVRRALLADQQYSDGLVAKYAAEIATLQEGLDNALAEVARAPPFTACDQSPRARAFDRSLRYLYSPPIGKSLPTR